MYKLEKLHQQIKQLSDDNPHKELLFMNLEAIKAYEQNKKSRIKSPLKTTTHYRYN